MILLFSYIENFLHLLAYDPSSPMLFNTGFFFWFFTAFIILYTVFSKYKNGRAAILIIFSLYFYYKASGHFVLLLFISALVEYAIISGLSQTESHRSKSLLLWISVIINLGSLLYFKYFNFFLKTYSSVTSTGITLPEIILPIGISFFTFQKLGYTINVYNGTSQPVRNILEYISFVCFFPVIEAGPILRGNNFFSQFNQKPVITNEDLGKAIFLIISGLIKKSVISDYIGVNFVDRIFDNPALYSGFENLAAMFGYTLQIYCDFSGYSDIAIGIALLIGIKIPANFRSPYKSLSLQEFWQRWHISLSFWFRDFFFLPVAYSIVRKLKNKRFLGIRPENWSYHVGMFLTMTLCGFWHGANFTFIVWGMLYGIGISVERILKKKMKFKSNKFSKFAGWLITFIFVSCLWVLFRANSFETAGLVFHQIFTQFDFAIIPQVISGYKIVFLLILMGYTMHFVPEKADITLENLVIKSPLVLKIAYFVIAVWLVSQMRFTQLLPFIYFNF